MEPRCTNRPSISSAPAEVGPSDVRTDPSQAVLLQHVYLLEDSSREVRRSFSLQLALSGELPLYLLPLMQRVLLCERDEVVQRHLLHCAAHWGAKAPELAPELLYLCGSASTPIAVAALEQLTQYGLAAAEVAPALAGMLASAASPYLTAALSQALDEICPQSATLFGELRAPMNSRQRVERALFDLFAEEHRARRVAALKGVTDSPATSAQQWRIALYGAVLLLRELPLEARNEWRCWAEAVCALPESERLQCVLLQEAAHHSEFNALYRVAGVFAQRKGVEQESVQIVVQGLSARDDDLFQEMVQVARKVVRDPGSEAGPQIAAHLAERLVDERDLLRVQLLLLAARDARHAVAQIADACMRRCVEHSDVEMQRELFATLTALAPYAPLASRQSIARFACYRIGEPGDVLIREKVELVYAVGELAGAALPRLCTMLRDSDPELLSTVAQTIDRLVIRQRLGPIRRMDLLEKLQETLSTLRQQFGAEKLLPAIEALKFASVSTLYPVVRSAWARRFLTQMF